MAQDTGLSPHPNSEDWDGACPNAGESFPGHLSWEFAETTPMQHGDMRSLCELLHVTNMIVGTLEQLHRQSALNEMGPYLDRAKKSLAEINAFLKRNRG